IGLCSTDMLYFAVGKLDYDGGAMVTASHNPPQWNGLKLCRTGALSLSGEEGLPDIKDAIIHDRYRSVAHVGAIHRQDMGDSFADHVLAFIDRTVIRPFTIVIDAGNGMAGKVAPLIFTHLPCRIIPLYFDLDGSFPHHIPSPIAPENIRDLQRFILDNNADLGIAFDGDADRVFLVDEQAEAISGGLMTAIVAQSLLRRHRGATILYNLICSRVVPEIIKEGGGHPVVTRVGHSYIKQHMRQMNGLFAGEHSGHYYFRDNYYADSGIIAALYVLELLSQGKTPLSEIVRPLKRYAASGEINTPVEDKEGKMREIAERFSDAEEISYLDGVSICYPDVWFNVRPSNTEPLLRLNVEGASQEKMEMMKDRVLAMIRGTT
ncbi:MAG: phosphomannomutase/phosphoglucomutase, partial [Candidatus Latescibacteria bacterium]|nr:phosphomannomutase/phosphoglucomutase [Candidatus Latescibacterota bacterium]